MQQAVDSVINKNADKNINVTKNVANATGDIKVNTTGKLVGKILSIVLWAVVIFLCIALVSTIISGGEKSVFGFRSYYVRTDSMTPTFSAGSWILVKERNIDDIEVGDILTFKIKDSLTTIVTHRCIKIDKDENGDVQLWTQGDANSAPDNNPVIKERLLGETIFWIGGLGGLLSRFQSPPGYIFLGVIVFLMIFVPEFINYVKKQKY